MTTATHTAIYTHHLAFDGHATASFVERRLPKPRKEVSTITFSTTAHHIIRASVRPNDLVEVSGTTVTVVVTASQRDAKAIAQRLNKACALAGYGVPKLLRISTSCF